MREPNLEEMIAETREQRGEKAAAQEEELFAAFADLVQGDRLQRVFHENFVTDRASS